MSNKNGQTNVVVKKRGRKSKKEIEEIAQQAKLLAALDTDKENINITKCIYWFIYYKLLHIVIICII